MTHRSKRMKAIDNLIVPGKIYKLDEALELIKKCPALKFDQSIDVSIKMGVDLKKPEQMVRGTVSLPNGTGKKMTVLVFAKGEKAAEALKAGADYAGADDLIEKVKTGWTDFDAVVATPEMMREVGKLGKILGVKGLMPTPKAGTVTNDVSKAVQELKAGKIEFKMDKLGLINNAVGKISFDVKSLEENIKTFYQALLRAKPASAKGSFVKNFVLSSTMGPGLKIDASALA